MERILLITTWDALWKEEEDRKKRYTLLFQ
jgi:hypothetical protein